MSAETIAVGRAMAWLMPFAKERLDRIVNIVLRVHPAGQHLFMIPQMLVQDVDEVAASVG
jgi:hypothetical protein